MKIAPLTTDNREHERTYSETSPRFGRVPQARLREFAGSDKAGILENNSIFINFYRRIIERACL